MRNKIILNADNEIPNCMRCTVDCSDKICEEYCGPAHGWYRYERIIFLDEYSFGESEI